MSSALRREYLAAMGLESWVVRVPGSGRVLVATPAGATESLGAPVSASPAASMTAAKPAAGTGATLTAAGAFEPAEAGMAMVTTGEPAAALSPATLPGVNTFAVRPMPLADRPSSTAPPVPPNRGWVATESSAAVQAAKSTQRKVPTAVALAAPLRPGADRESAYDWTQLRERVAACTRCGLAATRTQTVFGVGSHEAAWLVVGEAPGAEEDRQGEPFVGRAGQLLNSMLRAIGLAREQVYIANMLKCRPPNNRDPAAGEVTECAPFLERQVQLLKPKIMLVVGRIAAQNLLQTPLPLGRLRQQVHVYGASQVPLVVTYHPAYLLRTPTDKRKAWEDLQFAREVSARG